MLAVEDLVRARKTQRDRDWPMIRRLLEQSYFGRRGAATQDLVRFCLEAEEREEYWAPLKRELEQFRLA